MADKDIQISNTLIMGLFAFVEAMGFAPEAVLEGTSFRLSSFADIDGYITENEYDTLYENCIRLTGDSLFGLHMGATLSLQQLGVLGYLLMNSDSFQSALKAYENFQSSLGESVVIRTQVNNSTTRISFEILGVHKTRRHRVESFFSALLRAGEELTGRDIRYLNVGTTFDIMSSDKDEYSKILGLVPGAANENFVEFSSTYLNLPIINSVPELTPVFESKLQDKMSRLDTDSFAKKVRRELSRRIGKEKMTSLESISEFFGMSERNFQLKLEQEDTSFRHIHEEAQADFAIRFLKNNSPIAEIAYALGFSEPSAFQRAFKRWTGKTPGQFRLRHHT